MVDMHVDAHFKPKLKLIERLFGKKYIPDGTEIKPYLTIHGAIDAVKDEDKGYTIYIKAGNYIL